MRGAALVCLALGAATLGCAAIAGIEDWQPGATAASSASAGGGGAGSGTGGGGAPASQWPRALAGPGNELVTGAAAGAAGQVVVCGVYDAPFDPGGGTLPLAANETYGFFLVMLDPDGSTRWARRLGTVPALDSATCAVALDPVTGDAIVAGTYVGTMDGLGPPLVNTNYADVFVARLAAGSGEPLWATTNNEFNSQLAFDLAIDATGNVVIGGAFNYSLSLPGCPPLTTNAPLQPFLAVLDGSGTCLRAAQLISTAQSFITRVVSGVDGVTVAGTFGGDLLVGAQMFTSLGPMGDVFLAHFDATLSPVWGYDVAPDGQRGLGLARLDDGSFVVAAGTTSLYDASPVALGGTDVFVQRFDEAGAPGVAAVFGSSGDDVMASIRSAGQALLVGGSFTGELSPNGPKVAGPADSLVLRLKDDLTASAPVLFDGPDADGVAFALPTGSREIAVGGYVDSIKIGATKLVSAGGFDVFVTPLSK